MRLHTEEIPKRVEGQRHPITENRTDEIISHLSPRPMASDEQGPKAQIVLERFFPVRKTAGSKSSDNVSKELYVSDSQEVESTILDEGGDAGKESGEKKYVCDSREMELAILDREEGFGKKSVVKRDYSNVPVRPSFARGSSAPCSDGGVNDDAFALRDDDRAENNAIQSRPQKYRSDPKRDESSDRFSGVKLFVGHNKGTIKVKPGSGPQTPERAEVIELSDDEDDSPTKSTIEAQDANTEDYAELCHSKMPSEERSRYTSKRSPSEDRSTDSSKTEVIDLLETENDKSEVGGSSARDKAYIKDLELAIIKHTATIKQQRENIRELEETLADVAEEKKVANKMITLRRQHKNALTASSRANHENMAKLRESTMEKLDAMKAEYKEKKDTMRKQFNNRISAKDRAVQEAKASLDMLKEQTKEKLEEAKAKAADARTQKTRNNADIEALKKQLRDEHAEEVLSCRPENNRRIQERDEQIKTLKVQIRELEKANAKCKTDVATLRDSLREEFDRELKTNRERDEMGGKYRKYKSFATRLDAELKAQAVKHGVDKAEMVARAEERTYQQEQKWSLQWNIAQQKSGEVVRLNRIVSELRDGQGRRDAVIRDLRRELLAVGGEIKRPRDKKLDDEAATTEEGGGGEEEEENNEDLAEKAGKQKKLEGDKDQDELSGAGVKRKAAVLEEREIKRSKIER